MGKNMKLKLDDLKVQSFVTSAENDKNAKGGITLACPSLWLNCTVIPGCPGSTQCGHSGCANCPDPGTGDSDCLCSGVNFCTNGGRYSDCCGETIPPCGGLTCLGHDC